MREFKWQYPFNVLEEDIVQHLKGKDFVTWPQQMGKDPKAKNSKSYVLSTKGMDMKPKNVGFFKIEVEILIQMGHHK